MRLRDVALLTLMAIGTIVFLPVLIPAAIVYTSVRGRRMRRAAETFGCVVCGMVLTAQAVEWADRECQGEGSEMRRKYPHDICRARERTCHAICPAAGRDTRTWSASGRSRRIRRAAARRTVRRPPSRSSAERMKFRARAGW
jgi:hypothetical protein